jgi:hypothetical protein
MSNTTPEEALKILQEFFPEGFYVDIENDKVKPILGARDAVTALHEVYPEGVVIDGDGETFGLDKVLATVRITNCAWLIIGFLLGAALVLLL